jgi:hypothetical protein
MSEKNITTKVVTGRVRLSFVNLFEPKSIDGGKAKYSCLLLIPKSDTKTLNDINNAIDAAKEAGKVSKFGGKIPANVKITLRDGDEEKDTEEFPEYKGCYFMNASSEHRPSVVDKGVKKILDPSEVYSGCYARVSLNFYAYNTSGNKGISAGLGNVQKLADGDYLSGHSTPEEDFGDSWSDEEDDLV